MSTTPAPLPSQAPGMFSPRDSQLLKRYLIGGAGVGAGAGLVTSILNYLGTLKDEAAEAKPNNEDVYYLNLRRKKEDKSASVAGTLALSGAALTGLGSYAIVRALYQKYKKQKVKERLEQAQNGYLDVLDTAPKSASEGKAMGMTEGLLSTPAAVALLLGLASATVSNQMLKKTFPGRKPPGRRDPRRVIIRTIDDKKTPDEDLEKVASQGNELVLRLLMATKSAALNEFKDLICAVGQGRHDEVANGILHFGGYTTQEMVKGASRSDLGEPYLSLAIGNVANCPAIGPSVDLMAAIEFNEHFPSLSKTAMLLDEDEQEILIKVAGLAAAAIRNEATIPMEIPDFYVADPREDWVKDAALMSILEGILTTRRAQQLAAEEDHSVTDMEADPDDTPQLNINSGARISETETENSPKRKKKRIDVLSNDPKAQEFENTHKDVIDAALAG